MKTIFIIAFLIAGFVSAQTTTFFKTYGGSGYSVIQTTDSGFVVTGSSGGDVWLVKTDFLGDTIFTKKYSTVFWDLGYSIEQTMDSGFIIAGRFGKPDTMMEGSADVYIIKTDEQGDTLWTKIWGLIPDTLPDEGLGDYGYSVQQTIDGGYIVAGMYNNSLNWSGIYPPTAFLTKLDSFGNLVWAKTYTNSSAALSVVQTFDGGYIFSGNNGVLRTDSFGDTIWTKSYVGTGYSIIQTSDSNIVVTGGNGNVFLNKLDMNGNVIWSKDYDRGCNNNDYGYSVDECTDGGFIITGGTYCSEFSQFTNTDVWLLKTDSNGDTLWTKNYGGSGNDVGYSIKQCFDEGFVLTGNTTGGMFLIKTDSLGNVYTGIFELNPNVLSYILYPNPISNDQINVDYELEENTSIIFKVIDSYGREVYVKRESKTAGVHHEQINLSNLSRGIYFFVAEIDGITQSNKIVKVR